MSEKTTAVSGYGIRLMSDLVHVTGPTERLLRIIGKNSKDIQAASTIHGKLDLPVTLEEISQEYFSSHFREIQRDPAIAEILNPLQIKAGYKRSVLNVRESSYTVADTCVVALIPLVIFGPTGAKVQDSKDEGAELLGRSRQIKLDAGSVIVLASGTQLLTAEETTVICAVFLFDRKT